MQGSSKITVVAAMASTPPATRRADVSLTGFGKRNRAELNMDVQLLVWTCCSGWQPVWSA